MTVNASGSVTVRAYGSVTVNASGSVTVRAYGSVTVNASGSVTVTTASNKRKECGGGLHFVARPFEGLAYDVKRVEAPGCLLNDAAVESLIAARHSLPDDWERVALSVRGSGHHYVYEARFLHKTPTDVCGPFFDHDGVGTRVTEPEFLQDERTCRGSMRGLAAFSDALRLTQAFTGAEPPRWPEHYCGRAAHEPHIYAIPGGKRYCPGTPTT